MRTESEAAEAKPWVQEKRGSTWRCATQDVDAVMQGLEVAEILQTCGDSMRKFARSAARLAKAEYSSESLHVPWELAVCESLHTPAPRR